MDFLVIIAIFNSCIMSILDNPIFSGGQPDNLIPFLGGSIGYYIENILTHT